VYFIRYLIITGGYPTVQPEGLDRLAELALRDKSTLHDERQKVKVGPWAEIRSHTQFTKDGTLSVIVVLVYLARGSTLTQSSSFCQRRLEFLFLLVFLVFTDVFVPQKRTGTALLDYQKIALERNVQDALDTYERELKEERAAARLASSRKARSRSKKRAKGDQLCCLT